MEYMVSCFTFPVETLGIKGKENKPSDEKFGKKISEFGFVVNLIRKAGK